MALEIKVGDVATEVKRGTSAKGEWGYAIIRAEKGTDKIQVWFDNAADIPSDTFAVTIEAITRVGIKAQEYPKGSGKWYKNTEINAKVSSASSGATPTDIDFGEEDMPF